MRVAAVLLVAALYPLTSWPISLYMEMTKG